MSKTDWYRRETWTSDDRREFFSRHKRAHEHNKPQYLRIQAWHLEQTGKPELINAALELLNLMIEKYPSPIQLASAHHQRATCLEAIRRHDEAIEAYRDAMQAQREFPNVKTNAALDFGMFAVRHRHAMLYDEVLATLEEFIEDLRFPYEQYQFNAILAMIASHDGDNLEAKRCARRAMAAYARKDSGLRYHPRVGLVTEPNGEILNMLKDLCDA